MIPCQYVCLTPTMRQMYLFVLRQKILRIFDLLFHLIWLEVDKEMQKVYSIEIEMR